MKKIILIAVIIATQMACGQVKKDVGNFTKIKVFDRISVVLIKSDQERVEITGSRADEVEVINKNGELKIRMALKKLLDGEEISVNVYFRELTNIDANEGSFVASEHKFDQAYIYASAQEGAGVKLTLKVAKSEFRAATGGTITVTGTASNQDVRLGAGGILKAKDLKSSHVSVDVKAGGEAQVRASEIVDATVVAGGSIKIYGKPQKINRKTTLGGSIEEVAD